MQRQLIVVVHGVGVRDAGVATGQLSAALGSEIVDGQAEEPDPWHPHSTDDFLLHEDERYSASDLLPIFPAHLRRFRRYERDDPTKVRQERVIADFFWGDISGTGIGPVRVMVGLIKIVLGLSHAIRENAMDVFPGADWRDRGLRRLARAAALLIHGPVVAINFVLFGGVVLTLGWHAVNGAGFAAAATPEWGWFWTELVIGVVAIGIGLLISRKGQVFLLRHLASWLVITGVVVILIAVFQALFPLKMAQLMVWVNALVFASPEMELAEGATALGQGFAPVAAVLMGLMVASWTLALGIAWLITFECLRRGRAAMAMSFVPQAISLMSILWMMLMTALWTVALGVNWLVDAHSTFLLPQGLKTEMVMACLRFVTPAAGALLVLALVALAVHIRKGRRFDPGVPYVPATYLPDRAALAEKHRLIVGWALLRVLDLFLVVMTVFFVIMIAKGPVSDWVRGINDLVMPTLVVGVGILTVVTILAGQRGLATGVAIFTDVLVYLNDYSWISREMDPDIGTGRLARQPRTVLERVLGILPDGTDNRKQGFWLRGRIHARMEMLMERLITDEKPAEIAVVSHSQGTVIAADVIAEHGLGWVGREGGARRLKLVTMGSPYSHLYAHYFPSAFPDAGSRPPLCVKGPDCVLEDWINVFRVDDFVGTHIDRTTVLTAADVGKGWPREYPVPRNGHTNYWVDSNVFPILQANLVFKSGTVSD